MKIVKLIIRWVCALLVPLALVFLGVRLLLTDLFLNLEYRSPGFPADTYGFSTSDRIGWAKVSREYLLNNEGNSFLGEKRFSDGSPLFNERELSHMLDVKNVLKPVMYLGYGSWYLVLLFGIFARWGGYFGEYRRGLRLGGWIMLGMVVVIGMTAAISFWKFFEIFHGLFFTGDSWLFQYSDSLIRLFPIRFWQDAFLYVAIISILGSIGLIIGLKPRKKGGVKSGKSA